MNIITTVGDLRKALSAYDQEAKIIFTINGKKTQSPYTDLCLHAAFHPGTLTVSHVELNVQKDLGISDGELKNLQGIRLGYWKQ